MTNKTDSRAEGKNGGSIGSGGLREPNGQPVFILEDLYPNASSLFAPSHVPTADNPETLVSFDTNALLLPYNIASQDLTALAKVLKDLAEGNRLFVAGRVAREFIKNRDRKLADMLKALKDKTSRVQLPEQKLSPLLDGVEGYEDVTAAAETLAEAWKVYRKAQEKIVLRMREWRGNDPVSLVYNEVLGNGRIVEIDDERDALQKEWDARRANRTPPGHKDSSKDDTGIGDFLIWKTLLKLGATHKKDLIFITGEEKADWFVRSDSERVYPRPELVDEYRRASGGKNIRLSTLGELLEEMRAPPEVVFEVKTAEQQANNAIQGTSSSFSSGANPLHPVWLKREETGSELIEFDYSTSDGMISLKKDGAAFDFKFSKASNRSIHLYRIGSTSRIARVKSADRGMLLDINDFDTTSRSYTINVNEGFMLENDQGDIFVGRILRIQDDSRGDLYDRVAFLPAFFSKGDQPIMP